MTLKPRQRGFIFFALVLMLFVTGSTFVISALNNRQASAIAQQAELRYQMQLAKQALLGYAASVDDLFSAGPGHLPCPDLDNDGLPNENPLTELATGCSPSTEYFGRLPEYVELSSLNVAGNPLRYYLNNTYADVDQQFWYAVTPAYIHDSTGSLVANSTVSGTLTLDGTSVVAMIVAPGESLGQNRAANPDDYAQYLEGGNGDDTAFITSDVSNPTGFNDTLLAITRDEIMAVATVAVARRIRVRMEDYYASCGHLPKASVSYLCNTNASAAANNFRAVLNNGTSLPNWVKANAVYTGKQNWAQVSSVANYANVNDDESTLYFTNCAGIDFTYTADPGTDTVGLSQAGTSCN